MFIRTTAINKLLALKKRIKVIQGGTWAGKTYGIIAILIDFAIRNPNRTITVVAESIPAVKRGPLTNFKEIMFVTNRWIETHYNATERIYTFSSGSTMEFTSFDSIGKAQAAGKRTDLFLNEAYYINFEIADALMGRTSGNIWIDYNPHNTFWVQDELLGRDDIDFIKLIPGDNEALPETIKKEHAIKREKAKTSEYWANWCRIFLDGETGRSMGAILKNWIFGEFDNSLAYGFGLDFGFKDPDALVRVAPDKKQMKLYWKEELYQSGLSTKQLGEQIKVITQDKLTVADSSAARTIADLKGQGINIKPVIKGKITDDIKMLMDYELIIDPKSTNLSRELGSWVWLDKKGEVPIDEDNHLIDAGRYYSRSVILPFVQRPKQRAL
jgi:phage terminase large subunit